MPSWVKWLWITLALLGAMWLAWRLTELLLVIGLALLVTAALVPIARLIEARGLPRPWSRYLVFLTFLGVIAGLFAFLLPLIVQQSAHLAERLPELGRHLDWLEGRWTAWRDRFTFLPQFAELSDRIVSIATAGAQRLIGLTGQFVSLAVGLFTLLFLVFFFLKDGGELQRQVLGLMPVRARSDAEVVMERVGYRAGRYFLGQLVVMTVDGVLTGVLLALLGVPYAVLLGVLTGLFAIVPFIGPLLGAVPGVLIGFSISPAMGLWVILVYWGVQQVEGYLVYPYVTGRAVRLHPVWVVLAFVAAGMLLGVVGLILAVPAAATLHILIEELYLPRLRGAEPPPAPPPQAVGP